MSVCVFRGSNVLTEAFNGMITLIIEVTNDKNELNNEIIVNIIEKSNNKMNDFNKILNYSKNIEKINENIENNAANMIINEQLKWRIDLLQKIETLLYKSFL